MSDTVIKVENLSKSAPKGLPISHQNGERYTALRDVLTNGAKSLGRRLRFTQHVKNSGPAMTSSLRLVPQGAKGETGQARPRGNPAPSRHPFDPAQDRPFD